MKNKSNLTAIIFIFITMILLATVENARGVFIPIFKKDFSISDISIGRMLLVSSLGYIFSTFIGGALCEKLGQKKVFALGFVFIIISLAILSIDYNFIVFLIAMFIMNVGLALTSIAINTLVPILFISYQAILMNLTHFCYGLGSTAVQRTSGILVNGGISWRSIYLAEAVVLIIALIIFIKIEIPRPTRDKRQKIVKKSLLFKDKYLYFFAASLGFYVFAEVGTSNWFVNYMQQVYKFNADKSSFYLSLFFGIFTVGRLVGGFVVEKNGYLNTVIKSLVIAVILFITGLEFGQKGMIIISVSGLFFAVGFPTIVLSIRKVFKENCEYITGVVITISSSINMILNYIIGILNVKIGAYLAFYLIPISLILSIIFVSIIYINKKECYE